MILMVDAYKYEPEGVATVISALNKRKSQYNDIITELKNLIDTINNSPAWIDLSIKSSFINTCSSYLKIYNSTIISLEAYIDYLTKKSENAKELESTYAGGQNV